MIFKKYGFLNDKDLETYDKVTFLMIKTILF